MRRQISSHWTGYCYVDSRFPGLRLRRINMTETVQIWLDSSACAASASARVGSDTSSLSGLSGFATTRSAIRETEYKLARAVGEFIPAALTRQRDKQYA
jgi:hypothetical protein